MTTPTRSMARMAHSPPSPPPSAARLGLDSDCWVSPIGLPPVVVAVGWTSAPVLMVLSAKRIVVKFSQCSQSVQDLLHGIPASCSKTLHTIPASCSQAEMSSDHPWLVPWIQYPLIPEDRLLWPRHEFPQ